jgi:hypothetical protein
MIPSSKEMVAGLVYKGWDIRLSFSLYFPSILLSSSPKTTKQLILEIHTKNAISTPNLRDYYPRYGY